MLDKTDIRDLLVLVGFIVLLVAGGTALQMAKFVHDCHNTGGHIENVFGETTWCRY